MSVTVNGIAVDAGLWASPEVAAVRELLRQRAIELALLESDNSDVESIDAGIDRLLAKEVQVPTPTEAECRRH